MHLGSGCRRWRKLDRQEVPQFTIIEGRRNDVVAGVIEKGKDVSVRPGASSSFLRLGLEMTSQLLSFRFL